MTIEDVFATVIADAQCQTDPQRWYRALIQARQQLTHPAWHLAYHRRASGAVREAVEGVLNTWRAEFGESLEDLLLEANHGTHGDPAAEIELLSMEIVSAVGAALVALDEPPVNLKEK